MRIPTQDAPAAYFEAGIVAVGRVLPFGDRCDWQTSATAEPNAIATADQRGTSYATETGPPLRSMTVSWQDAANLAGIRESVAPDYRGVSGGRALVADEDIPYQMVGVLEELRSGEIPCVLIEELPAATGMLIDRQRVLYSRIGSAVTMNRISGDLGTDEIVRVESITFNEIV